MLCVDCARCLPNRFGNATANRNKLVSRNGTPATTRAVIEEEHFFMCANGGISFTGLPAFRGFLITVILDSANGDRLDAPSAGFEVMAYVPGAPAW